jgi:hypothetical protein
MRVSPPGLRVERRRVALLPPKEPTMSEQVPAQPQPVTRKWWRNRWVLGLGLIVLVVIIVAASSGSSASNGWTASAKAQTLQECEADASTQACGCAIRWFEGHLSPSQLVAAAQNGQYVQEGEALLTACPGVRGSGLLGN